MDKKKKKDDFEENLARLEKIVERIENAEVGLEETLRIFEEGIGIAKDCQKILEDAELKITKLVDSDGGKK
ncbi:MAG: exodeoxyribonuclease VII small subunit [bacterium]